MLRAALIYRCKHHYLEGSLTVWPFTQIIVEDPHPGPVTSQLLSFGQFHITWSDFHPAPQALNPIRELMVTSLTDMPLLDQWAHLAWQIDILADKEEFFGWVLAWLHYDLQPKCLMSWTIGFYHLVMVGNKSNHDSGTVLFVGLYCLLE